MIVKGTKFSLKLQNTKLLYKQSDFLVSNLMYWYEHDMSKS